MHPTRTAKTIGLHRGIVFSMAAIVLATVAGVAATMALLANAAVSESTFVTSAGATVLIAACVASLAIHLTLQRQLKPLRELRSAMHALGNDEFGVRLPDGGYRDLAFLARRFNVMAERLEQSRIAATANASMLARDVEARAAELECANQQLLTLDQAKDAFLSNVSHEMRTPLTSIIAACEILQNFTQDDPQARDEFLTILDREAQRLLKSIDSILEFAKMEAQELDLDRASHDLRDLVNTSVSLVVPRARARRISIHTSLPDHAVLASCDRARIAQVAEHLIDNAIKFSAEGGRVDIELSTEAYHGTIRVKDEGFGVPRQKRATLFGAMQSRDSVLTDKPKGVGLGLALSSGIVKAHGGTLSYEEREYRGACFVVRLPLEQTRPARATDLAWPVPDSQAEPRLEHANASGGTSLGNAPSPR